MNPANIGRYAIKSEIARGGMATVYLAFDPYVKREVAIKLLPANLTQDLTFRTRFEREAQTVAALEYPAIVPVYDFGEETGQPYLVMRYMTGGSLAQKIKSAPLSLSEVSRIFTRLSAALDHVHAKGIIHRDLKPANILFDTYNNAYLSDFGIAHIAAGNAALTGEGMVGTPAYMSPEQARGDANIDGRSDLYSLGAILFEALTGRQPYEATTPLGVAVKHLTEPIPRLADVNANLPYQCQDVIDKAMAKESEQRYQSAASLAQTLMLIANKTLKNPPIPEEEPTARMQSPVPRRVHLPQTSVAGVGLAPEQPLQPAAALVRPVNTPLPPSHLPNEPQRISRKRPPIWLWILLGAAALAALCLLGSIVLWLLLSGTWQISPG
jgi:serine/threonine protein kinase